MPFHELFVARYSTRFWSSLERGVLPRLHVGLAGNGAHLSSGLLASAPPAPPRVGTRH